jgi:Lon protease-like protein
MSEIGLFPLGIVLLPTEHVPLHIFEPRYRELIEECLANDGEFGLLLAEDDQAPRDLGTRAAVVSVIERFPDGRLNIVIEGRERFRLVEETSGRSFRTATVEPIADDGAPNDPDRVAHALRLYARLLEIAGASADTPEADHPQLSYAIAGRFELAAELKLDLLAMTSEPERLERVCEILSSAAHTIERQQQIAAIAQTNGKGH